MTLTTRPSSADLAWNCAASLDSTPEEVRINLSHEVTEAGSAFHEWAEGIEKPRDEQADIGELTARYAVSRQDVEILAAYARRVWFADLQQWLGGGETEVRLAAQGSLLHVAGRVDRLKIVSETLGRILDWKTGYIERSHEHAMRMYAWLMCQTYPKLETVSVWIVYVRLQFFEVVTYTRDELDRWFASFRQRLRDGAGVYSPGEHCGFCPRRLSCPGHREYMNSSLAVLDDAPIVWNEHADALATVGPELAARRSHVKYIEARCKEFNDALKAFVTKNGGSIPAGDGKVLRLVPTVRRHLRTDIALPILQDELSERGLNQAVTLKVGKALDAYADEDEKGNKAAAVRELTEVLEKSGALYTTQSHSLRVTKAAPVALPEAGAVT